MRGFDHINTWVFDLDNTLYPASCRLFDQMHVRMSDFIVQHLGVDNEQACRMRREYYLRHGTTLRGLMVEHDMKPDDFLEYVHDIDYDMVKADSVLQSALAKLPGRKLVFTNGSAGHAVRVMQRLGVDDHFDGVFDIVDSGYIPKPARLPYDKFAGQFAIDGSRAAFFEDIAHNLETPHAMGMTTVLVTSDEQFSDTDADSQIHHYVHHTTPDLPNFLNGIAQSLHGEKR